MKRIAFYGGSFDPLHTGHLTIAETLTELFELDEFVFIPAFHAPHKKRLKPTSAYQRYAMICLATNEFEKIKVSKMELDVPEKPYTIETLTKLKYEMPDAEIFFVMGADSWEEITTWRDWENVLTIVNIIVVTRPGYEIGFDHVTDKIRDRIVDMRQISNFKIQISEDSKDVKNKPNPQSAIRNPQSIFITDAVKIDISATEIRKNAREKKEDWQSQVPRAVAKYIKKYDIY